MTIPQWNFQGFVHIFFLISGTNFQKDFLTSNLWPWWWQWGDNDNDCGIRVGRGTSPLYHASDEGESWWTGNRVGQRDDCDGDLILRSLMWWWFLEAKLPRLSWSLMVTWWHDSLIKILRGKFLLRMDILLRMLHAWDVLVVVVFWRVKKMMMRKFGGSGGETEPRE